MLLFHGGFMAAGFLLMTAGASMAKFLRNKRWWLRAHQRMGLAGSCSVVIGFVMAYGMVSLFDGDHLSVPHAYLGVTSFIIAILTPALGLMQFRFPAKAMTIRVVHRWSGRATIIMLSITIISGLLHAGII
jgi:hypothetical protein